MGTPGPRPKNFQGSPKVVKIVPLGSLTLLKRSGALKNNGYVYKYYVAIFYLAKVMPKARFLASVGVFGLFWGPLGANPRPVDCRTAKNPKFKNLSCFESFDQFFFQASQAP